MIYKYISALFLSTTLCSAAFAQHDTVSLNTVLQKMGKLYNERPIEKVYLHLDKPYYSVGDTIWFKAYLTDNFHLPSQLSKIVYVDIISSSDSLVSTLKLPVKNSVAYGELPLTEQNYRQDNYHIRAYTKWMMNFDNAYFFNKTIAVGNAIDRKLSTSISFSKPAGSNDASQITSRVVFKSFDGIPEAGKKVNWRIVVDGDDVDKGKATTDASGAITVTFNNKKSADLNLTNLVTYIDMGDKKTIGSTFSYKPALGKADIQFFPEGGDLVDGIRTKVAVKAIGSSGLGINFTGTISDNTGAVIANVNSQHAGMGAFYMVPETSKTYKANIKFSNGLTATYNLPKVTASGLKLSIVNNDPEKLSLRIAASPAFFQVNQGKTFYVVAQSSQAVCFAAQTMLKEQLLPASVPTSKFPTGVVQFTIFNSLGVPLSERLVFVQRKDQMHLTMNSAKTVYGTRQKVKLNILAKNATNAPVDGTFSVSVVDASKVPVDENAETTILSSLLLSSEIKGYIEKPNYYFAHINEQTTADLDLLMLTQGYRRFNYTDILADKLPQIFALPEQSIEITGILRTLNGMPYKGGNVRLLIPDKYFSASALSDVNGRFKFSNLVFPDSAKVVATAKNNYNSKNMMLNVDFDAYPSVGKNPNRADEIANIDSALRPYLVNSQHQYSNIHMLREVVIKETKAPKVANHMDYPALAGLSSMADHTVSGKMFGSCPLLVNCLQSFATGVTYDQENFYVTRDYTAGRRTPMAIFVGGMPVDVNYLNSLNPTEVESVEVFLKDDLGLINSAYQTNGVLVINTKKAPEGTKISLAEFKELIPQPSVVKFTPKGYNIAREFYSPKYDVPKPNIGVDLRSTIYWNPKVITEKATGATSVEFYNADGKGTYRAVIEGIDKEGNLGRYIYTYKVQ